MSKIVQILKLYGKGRSKLSISSQTGTTCTKAKMPLAALDAGGFSYEEICALNDI
ncbi:MAG: hypothetical protein V4543_15435 [Bacteroidota bacterium]